MLYRSTIFAFCILAICCKLSAQETICAVDIGTKSCQQKCGDYPLAFNCPGAPCIATLHGPKCAEPLFYVEYPVDQGEWNQQRPSYRIAGPNEQGFLTHEKYFPCIKHKPCITCVVNLHDLVYYCVEEGDLEDACLMESPEWIRQNNARIACPPEL